MGTTQNIVWATTREGIVYYYPAATLMPLVLGSNPSAATFSVFVP